jgi:hypothetical protein
MNYEQIQTDLGFTDADKATWLEINGKYYEDPEQGWKDKLIMHAFPTRSAAVYVMPGYESPASGKWIETPRQRREDFKSTGTREWEGMKNEKAHSDAMKKSEEAKQDQALDHAVRTAWQHMPEAKKQQALAEAG